MSTFSLPIPRRGTFPAQRRMNRAVMVFVCLLLSTKAIATSPGLGQPLTEAEAQAHSLTVLPDGSGLPTGNGTARTGEPVYQRHCLACHGLQGADGINDRLVGGHGSLRTKQPVRTIGSYWPYATTVFDFIRRAMPYNNPGTLTNDEIYGVTAYLLHLNGLIGAEDEMNAATLPGVTMPNQQNFVWIEGD